MFDVGPLELLVIIVLAVLVFGPERLPRLISQAAGWLRTIREQASSARDDLMAAAELDPKVTGDLRQSMNELAQLHPRNLASGLMGDLTNPKAGSADSTGNPRAAVAPPTPAAVTPPAGAAGAVAFDPDAT